jgi:hypothetical protein
VAAVEGRTDDVLVLPRPAGGTIAVHPVVVDRALDLLPCAGWQVREEADGLRLLIAGPSAGLDVALAGEGLRRALADAGAAPPPVRVEVVDSIPAGAAGKRPLIVARRGA